MSAKERLRLPDYLGHILAAIERIERYVDGIDEAAFLRDEKTQDAVLRNLEILGEAARSIERAWPDFAARHDEVPWMLIGAMRNRLAHGYFEIDLGITWKTVLTDLPVLMAACSRLLDELEAEPRRET
jgi:uncharacterized protein with HEPN domain